MRWPILLLSILVFACQPKENTSEEKASLARWNIIILGVAQDAGYPQAACNKKCCQNVSSPRMVSCLALANEAGDYWLFDATPDFRDQLQLASEKLGQSEIQLPRGIFLTHAHIGHYTGIMQLGREVIGASQQVVYAMPRLAQFLSENGPWSQLVSLQNIKLKGLQADTPIAIAEGVEVTPMLVPHRDEFSETVGYRINTPGKSILFISDIDKWEKWDLNIDSVIAEVDLAFLDGTFYAEGEIPGRDMSEIPHPFVQESMQRFTGMKEEEKAKIHFIHFNHTNPILWNKVTREAVLNRGFQIAEQGRIYPL